MYAKLEGPEGGAWEGGFRGEPQVDGALVLFPQYPQPLALSSRLAGWPITPGLWSGVECSAVLEAGSWKPDCPQVGTSSFLEPRLASVSSAVKREQAVLPYSVLKSVAKPR